jgi:hypothetical protein
VVDAGEARSTHREGVDVVVVEAVAAVSARHRSAAATPSAGVGWWPAFRLSSTGKGKGDGSR